MGRDLLHLLLLPFHRLGNYDSADFHGLGYNSTVVLHKLMVTIEH